MIKSRLISIITFLIILGVLGFGYNNLYYSYAPADWIFETDGYIAYDVNLSQDDRAYIGTNRTIHKPFQGRWIDELFLICQDCPGQKLRIYDVSGNAIYDPDKGDILYYNEIGDKNLEEGTYVWLFSIHATLPAGAERSFKFQSNEFEVYR